MWGVGERPSRGDLFRGLVGNFGAVGPAGAAFKPVGYLVFVPADRISAENYRGAKLAGANIPPDLNAAFANKRLNFFRAEDLARPLHIGHLLSFSCYAANTAGTERKPQSGANSTGRELLGDVRLRRRDTPLAGSGVLETTFVAPPSAPIQIRLAVQARSDLRCPVVRRKLGKEIFGAHP